MRSRVTGPIGTSSGSPQQVLITNGSPIAVSIGGGLDILKTEVHSIAGANINGSGGAWIALGDGLAMGATISELQMSYTGGEPIEFGTGANAGAAIRKWVANQGEGPQSLVIKLQSTDKLWIRSLSANSVDSGYITLNLMG